MRYKRAIRGLGIRFAIAAVVASAVATLIVLPLSRFVPGAIVGLRIWEGYAARIGLVPFMLGVVLAMGFALGLLGSIVPPLMALRTPRNIA